MESVEQTTDQRETSALEQLDVTLNSYRANMVGRVLVADDLYFKAFGLKLRAIVEEASRPAYTAPLTIPVHAIAEAYRHGARGWQILDAKDEQTWRLVADVVDCELGGQCPNAGDCNVLVSTAWSAGFDHRDGESSLWVRIPAEVTA